MRDDSVSRSSIQLCVALFVLCWAAGCGRLGYEPKASVDGGLDTGVPMDAPLDGHPDTEPTDSTVSTDTAIPRDAGEDVSVDSGAGTSWEFVGATFVGGTGNDVCFSLGMNAGGVHAITGKFSGTVDLGEGPVPSAGSADVFTIVYEADGSVRWARRYGGTAAEGGNDIDVDEEGRVMVAGEFRGNLDLGGGGLPNAGDLDLFIGTFTASADHVWSGAGGSSLGELGHASAFDGSGGGALVGYVRGMGTFDTTPTVVYGARDAVVARYAADGTLRWAHSWGGTGDEEARGVVIDSAGQVAAVGFYDSSFDVEVGPSTTVVGGPEGFVVAFDDSGTPVWVRTIIGPGTEEILGVAVDGANNLYVVGSYDTDAVFGATTPLPVAPGGGGFVASLDAEGNVRWVTTTGGSGGEVLHGVAFREGRVFATGYFDGGIEIGPLATSASTPRDSVWIALSAEDGTPIFGAHMEGVTALGIGASAGGLVAVGGYFGDTADFGAGPTSTAGSSDVFVARYAGR